MKVWLIMSWEVTRVMKKAVISQFLLVSIWGVKDLKVQCTIVFSQIPDAHQYNECEEHMK
jgi:hypothetical protein